jgi:hypothetical protein
VLIIITPRSKLGNFLHTLEGAAWRYLNNSLGFETACDGGKVGHFSTPNLRYNQVKVQLRFSNEAS